LSKEPKFFKHISENDIEFSKTHYLDAIKWLKDANDDLYDPDYGDVLRVAFTKQFERGKMSDLVSLLSGRNFETKSFEQEIMDRSFQELAASVLQVVNKTHFEDFVMTIKSAGFISKDLINSQNALNFAYVLYLKLREQGIDRDKIKRIVAKWFVMSLLTQRYSSSPESQFDADIKQVSKEGVNMILEHIEEAQLSEAFWRVQLVQDLEKASVNNPFLHLFFAAQIKAKDVGFLSTDITVQSMVEHRGDIHHIFPKEYLIANGYDKSSYNQIANFAYAQSEINIRIGKKAPHDYMGEVLEQCNGGVNRYGGLTSIQQFNDNLSHHCIPESIKKMDSSDYEVFLGERRKLMAQKIENYYKSL
jgi:hypothetical protein